MPHGRIAFANADLAGASDHRNSIREADRAGFYWSFQELKRTVLRERWLSGALEIPRSPRDNDTTLVVKRGDVERDLRIHADPRTFYTTDHYRGYPTVLIRLNNVTKDDLHDVVEVGWRRIAPKRLRDSRHDLPSRAIK